MLKVVVKSYGEPGKDLMAFYTSVVRSVVEYGAQVPHGGLTVEQCKDIERIQKRALRIIYPELNYNEALTRCGTNTLENRRETICNNLIKGMIEPAHKLNHLLPLPVNRIRERVPRLNGDKICIILIIEQNGSKIA